MDGDSLPHLSEIIQRYFTPPFQRLPIGDSDPSLKVDGMHRNRWTTSSGFTGRHAPESVVDINRNHWSTCTGIRINMKNIEKQYQCSFHGFKE
jgi:hypothetical protein